MAPPPAPLGPIRLGFGMGSVGECGSVGVRKTRYVSSTFFNRNNQLAVLKIRWCILRASGAGCAANPLIRINVICGDSNEINAVRC
jgi:hypothetical protein